MGESVRSGRRPPSPSPSNDCDVVVLGGGLAGSSAALLLKRRMPERRVVLLESRERFEQKVGESAIELSSWYLTRVLELDRHLALEHLPKYGLRFWFQNDRVQGFADASELGNRYQTQIPSYHVDRSILDEHVLQLAASEGVEVLRPARAVEIDLQSGDGVTIHTRSDDGPRRLQARWIVDASGRKALLARRLGLVESVPEHPVNSIWARFRGVADLDREHLPGRPDGGGKVPACSRGLSTNHLTGPGWWLWLIPLPGGETSVGLVWDERFASLPEGATVAERLRRFLKSNALCREALGRAEMVEHDIHALNNLPYRVKQVAGSNWILVGDAAGFLDPLYSPGLDWCSVTVLKGLDLIQASLTGRSPADAPARHAAMISRSYERWLQALYVDKYAYLGDAELMEIALRLDVSLYYFGIIGPPFREGVRGLEAPFAPKVSEPFFRMMRFAHRRLASLGRHRLRAGTWGRRNNGRQVLLHGFKLGFGALRYVPGAMARLARLELAALPSRLTGRRGSKHPRTTVRQEAPTR